MVHWTKHLTPLSKSVFVWEKEMMVPNPKDYCGDELKMDSIVIRIGSA